MALRKGYVYSFETALLKCLKEGYYIKGDNFKPNFKPGHYITKDKNGIIVLVFKEYKGLYHEDKSFRIYDGLLNQKFKVFSVANDNSSLPKYDKMFK